VNKIDSLGLFFAAACLIGCNGRSSGFSSAKSLRVTAAKDPAGYNGSVTNTVQPPYRKPAIAASAHSFGPTRAFPSSLRPAAPLQIMKGVVPAGAVGSDYDTALETTGGVPPYHWDTTAGQIAPGLTLRSSTGKISGIPFAPGAFSFTARVRDSTGASLSTTLSLNISAVPPLTVSDVVLDEGSPRFHPRPRISDQSRSR
jgi:hypothetical protein